MPMKSLRLALVLTLALPCASFSQVDPLVTTFRPVGPGDAATVLLPPQSVGGADGLSFTARCLDTNPRVARVDLAWRLGDPRASGQRVDITKFREGFATGRFDVTPRLADRVESVAVEAPEPGINYYWRVLTETVSGWVSSPIERFEVPICVSDGPVFRDPSS
jgi:hypothetical protein